MIEKSIKHISIDLEVTDETQTLVMPLILKLFRDEPNRNGLWRRIEDHLTKLEADLNEVRKLREAKTPR